MMRTVRSAALVVLSSWMLAASAARAELPNEALICRADDPPLDPVGYLRALALDLLGRLPTAEETAAVLEAGKVGDPLIDRWLASDELADRVVRHHRDLLWNNIDNVALLNNQAYFSIAQPGNLYWRSNPALRYRGGRVPCLDEPARHDEEGQIVYTTVDGVRREGWVEVEPYWAPSTRIKVCAYDAQTNLISGTGVRCGTNAGFNDRECGCGPSLRWCRYGGDPVPRAFARDVELRVRALIKEDRPYTELLTGRRAFVNGPIVHYWKYMLGMPANVRLDPAPVQVGDLPDQPYTAADTWQEIELPAEHAGVLTSPAFLLRFQTNRARANHFLDAFMCSPLSPPPGGLPAGARPDPDLQKRDGCKYCHALLEPTGSHWGRWTERGAGFLDPVQFPPKREDCEACGRTRQQCNSDCTLYYVTQALAPEEQPFLGGLRAYEFRREEHKRNIENGPRLLVLDGIVDGRLTTCVVRRAAERLLGRAIAPEEQPWLGQLTKDFTSGGYKYRTLLKAIVKSDVYRRVR